MAKKKKKRSIPYAVLTPETLIILQAAVKLLDQPAQRANQQDTRVVFATTLMAQIQGKLEQMQTSLGQMLLTTFDENEKVVLFHAMQCYLFDLQNAPEQHATPRTICRCTRIAASFTPDYLKAQLHQPGKGQING